MSCLTCASISGYLPPKEPVPVLVRTLYPDDSFVAFVFFTTLHRVSVTIDRCCPTCGRLFFLLFNWGPGFQFASDAARTWGWGDSLGGKAQVHLGQAPGSVFAVSGVGTIFGAVLEGRSRHAAASEASLAAGADGFGFASELLYSTSLLFHFFFFFLISSGKKSSKGLMDAS